MVVNFRTRDRGISWGARKLTRTFTLIIKKKIDEGRAFDVFCWVEIIVLRPDPVQGPGSRFWPGHRVGRVSFFFLKSKWRRFSKKTKINGFATRSCRVNRAAGSIRRVTPNFFFPRFFLQPGPVSASGRPGRVSKLWLK